MSECFLGEIRMFAFPFAPSGWAVCDGKQMNIQQNSALYSLLGTQFGGDGRNTFNLPDLRGRTPVHWGWGSYQGASFGTETITLTLSQIPWHNHFLTATTTAATTANATNNILAQSQPVSGQTTPQPIYAAQSSGNQVNLNDGSVLSAGSGTSHNNVQPSAVVNYCIALAGLYPPRS